jgi:hypothetical protein
LIIVRDQGLKALPLRGKCRGVHVLNHIDRGFDLDHSQ